MSSKVTSALTRAACMHEMARQARTSQRQAWCCMTAAATAQEQPVWHFGMQVLAAGDSACSEECTYCKRKELQPIERT